MVLFLKVGKFFYQGSEQDLLYEDCFYDFFIILSYIDGDN